MANQYEPRRSRAAEPRRSTGRAATRSSPVARSTMRAAPRKFLRFVVMETLACRDHRLKGYTIAVDVFGRGADFDAQSDPLVRVEAGRLRHRLLEHYQGHGRSSRLRIDLPRGCYVPRFSYAPAVPQPKIGGAAQAAARLWRRRGPRARALGSSRTQRRRLCAARPRRSSRRAGRASRGRRCGAEAARPAVLELERQPRSRLLRVRDDRGGHRAARQLQRRRASGHDAHGERQRRPGSRGGSGQIRRGLRADRQRAARRRYGPRGSAARRRRERRAAVG